MDLGLLLVITIVIALIIGVLGRNIILGLLAAVVLFVLVGMFLPTVVDWWDQRSHEIQQAQIEREARRAASAAQAQASQRQGTQPATPTPSQPAPTQPPAATQPPAVQPTAPRQQGMVTNVPTTADEAARAFGVDARHLSPHPKTGPINGWVIGEGNSIQTLHAWSLPAGVCVDYDPRSGSVTGAAWTQTMSPTSGRALIGQSGGSFSGYQATIYSSACHRG